MTEIPPLVHVIAVEPLGGFVLRLTFDDGAVGEVDLAPVLRGPIFEPLRNNPELFKKVIVDEELGTIVWPNGADMDPVVLHARATGTYDELMRRAASG